MLKFGVQIEQPVNAQVDEISDTQFATRSDPLFCGVTLTKLPPAYLNEPFESALSEGDADPLGSKLMAWTREEKKPGGGWALEWTHGGGANDKDMWGVSYRLIIDGVPYECATRTDSAEAAAWAARACGGLNKL